MKYPKIILTCLVLTVSQFAFAQTKYQLTHSYLKLGSRPQAYNGTIEISDSFLIFTSFPNPAVDPNDTVPNISKERIVKNKKGYYIKTIKGNMAHNYYIELSSDKNEKKQGVYDIILVAVNNRNQEITLFFKGKLAS